MIDDCEPCDYCGTFHIESFDCLSDMDDQPFCEQHPDEKPKLVRGKEGDDIGYGCPKCVEEGRCVYCGSHSCNPLDEPECEDGVYRNNTPF